MKAVDYMAALPMVAILAIIGGVLIFVGLLVMALTLKAILAVALVLMGGYLFIRPDRLAGLGNTAKIAVPLVLIVLAVIVYSGHLEV